MCVCRQPSEGPLKANGSTFVTQSCRNLIQFVATIRFLAGETQQARFSAASIRSARVVLCSAKGSGEKQAHKLKTSFSGNDNGLLKEQRPLENKHGTIQREVSPQSSQLKEVKGSPWYANNIINGQRHVNKAFLNVELRFADSWFLNNKATFARVVVLIWR